MKWDRAPPGHLWPCWEADAGKVTHTQFPSAALGDSKTPGAGWWLELPFPLPGPFLSGPPLPHLQGGCHSQTQWTEALSRGVHLFNVSV